jgi:mono/diheme cytochrome c family protein
MKNVLYAKVMFAGLLWGFLLAEPLPVAAAGDPAKGKEIFEKNCMVCHGPQGKGDGPTGKMLKPPAADLTSAASKKKSEADLRQVVENGKPGTAMPSWKSQLSQAELNDLLGYVMTLRK